MKKRYIFILGIFSLFILTFINIDNSYARVWFIDKEDTPATVGNQKPCQLGGYKYTSKDCTAQGKALKDICPTDPTYGKTCACDAKFKYDATNCTGGKSLTGEQCGGKYENCGCNESTYKWSSLTCTSPKQLTGNQCNNNPDGGPNSSLKILYDTCSCPTGYDVCSSDQIGVGTVCNDGKDKFASCSCNTTFMKCDNGGDTGAKSCTDTQGTKYTSCKAACTKTTAICASEIGGVAGDWTIANATEATCSCSTTKKYVIMQNDFAPVTYEYYKEKFKRIKAVKNFGNVKYGDLGGYVESESNLSQEGNSWVGCDSYGCAIVFGEAKVYGNAQVYGGPNGPIGDGDDSYGNVTIVANTAEVYGDAKIYGGSKIYAGKVYGNAIFHGYKHHPSDDRAASATSWAARISIAGEAYGNAQIYAGAGLGGSGSAGSTNNPKIYGNATMGCGITGYGSTTEVLCGRITYLGEVYENATILGNAEVSGSAKVHGSAKLYESAHVQGNAEVYGNAVIGGKGFYVQGDAKVYGSSVVTPKSTNAVVYLCGTAQFSGSVSLTGNAPSSGNTVICKNSYSTGTPAYQATSCSSSSCP
ncbi:MAG: hypothetical protein ACK5N8_06465 [Alphaproteobacteria bacterium]